MIYLICGAPGSGKSTYIERRRLYGDVVVDLDGFYRALTGLPFYEKPGSLYRYVHLVRDYALLQAVGLHKAGAVQNVWVPTGLPKLRARRREAIRLNAEVIVIETSVESCMKNIIGDARRGKNADAWRPIVRRWWRNYERDESDTVIDYLDLVSPHPQPLSRGEMGDQRK